jgi:hypothetical protein
MTFFGSESTSSGQMNREATRGEDDATATAATAAAGTQQQNKDGWFAVWKLRSAKAQAPSAKQRKFGRL